jgi:hypothetical protein
VRLRRAALHAGALALLVAGCGPVAPASVPATPAPPASAPASPTPSSSGARVTGVVEDLALLDVLPATVDGASVTAEHSSFTDAAADPDFGESIEAAAFALVVDGNDLASGVVARPVAGEFSDAFFRDWRTTYDEGACGQAGGISGTAETELGGRTVYVTTCKGGLRVYHAYVEERGLIVSLFSMGDRRFGEQLVAGLAP